MSDGTIRKDSERVRPKRRPSTLWLVVLIPFYALFVGVTARLSVELFEWGWRLFGWA